MSITADQEKSVLEGVPTQLFVAGEWRDASGGATLAVEDPSTGETLVEVADATPEDATAALDAAVAVQDEWAAHPPRERGEILRRAFQAITERADELALLMTLEMGKPIPESKAEITYAAEFFRWFAEEAVRIEGRFATAPNGQGRLITMKQPVGPCYAITPWNFPMAMGTRKIGPAVAAGCTMIVKPAQQTPLSMLALAQILQEAGLPAGVLSVITASSSSAVSKPIIEDPRLRKLTFTGSTPVGIKLVEQSARGLLRTSMELGGNAPFIVFADADVDDAVEGALIAKMRNMGEACTAANRFHVADRLAEEFTEKLASRIAEMKVGRGVDDGVKVGPLIDGDQLGKVAELVQDATAKGAQVVVGGRERDGAGYFYEPTVLGGVTGDAELLKEEIFGPVAPVIAFDDEDAAIAAANDTEYGLVAYLYTRDIKRAFRVAERLQTGMIGLNQGLVSNPAAPFGGVKASGFGREGGREGIEEYLETKYIAMAM
ncbi:MAG: succinate-semialdehyde dehydrogenase / glutarate-semialdehyde dehydrogenase [Solirubrobacteraceae bacterium]|jgi:succinate-semialdehyde dehydrogenase/glutarate-semialdehyde dehydrogenase|nr:succinate-semialdehyde dehydrogenase / glutarate-semialdehyde dehydrogenase [Solirubrobacteraceae bacterium]